MNRSRSLLLSAVLIGSAVHAQSIHSGPQLFCHRTDNEDIPENTLESLEQAALLGCDVVEIDVRRTSDGVLVLNHDGLLDRLTDGQGKLEDASYDEIALLDAGSWMSSRFTGMRVARFDDAVRLARLLNIRLILDLKTPGLEQDVLRILDREGMTARVQFNGEWADVQALLVSATDAGHNTAWVEPGISAAEVNELHRRGKTVVVNFSANSHQMDLVLMRSAVAAGADAINVDYPRLGADAVGRPVEAAIAKLKESARSGSDEERAAALRSLARYRGFDLQAFFLRALDTPFRQSSRAAAVALLTSFPKVHPEQIYLALRSPNNPARQNAAWLLGKLGAEAAQIAPLLSDPESVVRCEALRALANASGALPQEMIVPFLDSPDVLTRGAAAEALAHLHPQAGAALISAYLAREIEVERVLADRYVAGGRKSISPDEIAQATASFRTQMAMLHALAKIPGPEATEALVHFAFTPAHEFSQMSAVVAAFKLWDRAGDDPLPIIAALASSDDAVANRAEWVLIQTDCRVLPALRTALSDPRIQARVIRILAWHGDVVSLPTLQEMAYATGPQGELAAWAVEKIRLLNGARGGRSVSTPSHRAR